MSTPVLEINDLTVLERGEPVLDRVNITLGHQEFLGIIGPNGGGKTTLLKVILGLIKPDSGEIRVLGVSPSAARGRVGYVPQYIQFDASFPIVVRDVVLMGRLAKRRLFSRFTAADKQVAHSSLEKVEMTEFADRQIGSLSMGQLQRVLIARALASEPELILLDEPTASLDTKIGRDVYEVLDDLSKSMTIVLVSHDIGVISAHVRTIACLNRRLHYHHSKEISGEILQEVYGCPIELIAHGHAHRVLSSHSHEDEK